MHWWARRPSCKAPVRWSTVKVFQTSIGGSISLWNGVNCQNINQMSDQQEWRTCKHFKSFPEPLKGGMERLFLKIICVHVNVERCFVCVRISPVHTAHALILFQLGKEICLWNQVTHPRLIILIYKSLFVSLSCSERLAKIMYKKKKLQLENQHLGWLIYN